jgi:hypothetical protein
MHCQWQDAQIRDHVAFEPTRDVQRVCLVFNSKLSSTTSTALPHVANSALGQFAMAQVYSAQAYNRMPQPPPAGPSSRRHPFTNAVNHLPNMNPQATPPKPQEKQKQPASPPLPRQNAKITPPSPPKIICDKSGRFQFSRVGFLGEVCTLISKCNICLIVTIGWLRSCLRGQGSPRWTPGVQSRHQVIP